MKREYERYSWNGNKLYYKGEDTNVRLHRSRKYSNMWHFKTELDAISDMYNLDRAKDNAIKTDIADYNMRQSQLEARTCV